MSHPWESKKLTKWTTVELGDNEEIRNIQISNPTAVLPDGLFSVPDFLSEEEALALLVALDAESWTWEGFVQKRRVQSYECDADRSHMPQLLQDLLVRFESQLSTTKNQLEKRRSTHVVVEEFPFQAATPATTNAVVTTFESLAIVDEADEATSSSPYFVGQVSIYQAAVQHLNRPRKRHPECWQLQSKDHWTDVRMDPRTLFIKSGPAIWDWRSRVTRSTECDDEDRVVVAKFYNLPSEVLTMINSDKIHGDGPLTNSNGSTSLLTTIPPARIEEMPPLWDILTIIVTTSPIKSHPSTELLERTFDTFLLGGEDFVKCRKVIVCDGLRLQTGNVSKKHANVKQALRNGIATSVQSENYEKFKRQIAKLCQDATNPSPFVNTSVEELPTRHGYGFALRHALRHCVDTPYVCVIQHDRTFMRPTPMTEAVRAMWHDASRVKYIGVSMRSNLIYRDIFQSKYGKPAHDDLGKLMLQPAQLLVNATDYGPDSDSTQKMTIPSEKLRINLESVRTTYMTSAHYVGYREWVTKNAVPPGKHQMTLTPTLFWYDNTHIVETAHYRDFIFKPSYNMVARGGFVEEKTSPVMIKSVERLGLAAGHEKFGCYLLDDHSGYFFTGHLDGGSYIPREERERQYGSNGSKR